MCEAVLFVERMEVIKVTLNILGDLHTLRRDTHTHASSQVNEKVIRAFVVAVMAAVAIETPFLKIKSQMCFLHFLPSSVTVKKDVLKCLYC